MHYSGEKRIRVGTADFAKASNLSEEAILENLRVLMEQKTGASCSTDEIRAADDSEKQEANGDTRDEMPHFFDE